MRTLATGFGTCPRNPGSSRLETLDLITSVKTLFPHEVVLTGSAARTGTRLLGDPVRPAKSTCSGKPGNSWVSGVSRPFVLSPPEECFSVDHGAFGHIKLK